MPEHLALPVITGVVMEDVAPGQKLPTAEALSAVELIRLTAEDLRWQPRVVDISKGYCLTVTDNRKARITFGFDAIEDQLTKLHRLIELVEPSQKEFVSVNLMLERSIPVVFAAPASAQPALDPKTGKPKAGSGKNTPSAVPSKAADDLRADFSSTDAARKQSPGTSGDAAGAVVPRAPVSGGVVESNPEQVVKSAGIPKIPAAPAVAAVSTALVREKAPAKVAPIPERRGVVREEAATPDPQSRMRSKSASSAPITQPASSPGGRAPAETLKNEGTKASYSSKKTYRSKTAQSSSSQRRQGAGAASGAPDRALSQSSASASSGSRSKSGTGGATKEASPSARRPSLNPTEALRKLFSPHG
jgi:hypothetical protein